MSDTSSKEYKHLYYLAHKEEYARRRKQHYQEHKEEELAKNKSYRQAHSEQIRERGKKYAQEHANEIREYKKRWYEDNKETVREKRRAYCQKNKEYQRAWHGQYRKNKTGYVANKVYHAIKSGKLVPLPCENCGEPKAQAHHDDYREPLKVRWLCKKCHTKWHEEHTPIYV